MPKTSRRPGLLGLWRGRKALAIALSTALMGLMGATAISAVAIDYNAELMTNQQNKAYTAGGDKYDAGECKDYTSTAFDYWHFVVTPDGKTKPTGLNPAANPAVVASLGKGKVEGVETRTNGEGAFFIDVLTTKGATLNNIKASVLPLNTDFKIVLSHSCPAVETPPAETGYLTVEKRDKGTNALITTDEATFKFEWDSTSKTVTDNGDGDAENKVGQISVKLPLGETYTVTEVTAPEGYLKDPTPQTIKLTSGGMTLVFLNEKIQQGAQLGDLTVSKFDFDNRSTLLEGATFALWNESATVKLLTKTDGAGGDVADGKVTFEDLEYGKYNVQEVTAPKYFAKDATDIRAIEIDSATESLAFYNKRLTTTLVIEKRDADTKQLITGEGYAATFLIAWGSETRTVTDDKSGDAESDNGVIAVMNLPQGYEYTVTEMTAPVGYLKDSTSQKKILPDGKFVFYNEKLMPGEERGSVVVHKYIEGTEAHLGGATFQLIREDKPDTKIVVTDNSTGDADPMLGVVKFTDVQFGWTWVLSEVSAPEFYVKDAKTYEVKLTGANPSASYKFYNKRATADLTIFKRAGSTTGSLLGGATFTIARDGMTSLVVADNSELDLDKDNGEFRIAGLAAGYIYTVTETGVPAGYVGASAQTITLPTAGGTLTFVNTETGGGQTLTDSIEVRKYVKGTTTLLPGATFKITGPGLPTAGVTVVDGQGGDALDGMFSFTNLLVGQAYVVTEVSAPQYYKLLTASKTHTVVLGDNTLTFENERLTGAITVVKERTNTDTKLAGATFKFWREGAEASAMTVADNSALDVDKRDGYITVAGLEFGYKYLVQETVAPVGYKLTTTVFAVPNLSSEMVTFTVDNDVETQGGGVIPGGGGVLPGTGAGLSQQIGMGALSLLILGSLMIAFARTRRTN